MGKRNGYEVAFPRGRDDVETVNVLALNAREAMDIAANVMVARGDDDVRWGDAISVRLMMTDVHVRWATPAEEDTTELPRAVTYREAIALAQCQVAKLADALARDDIKGSAHLMAHAVAAIDEACRACSETAIAPDDVARLAKGEAP